MAKHYSIKKYHTSHSQLRNKLNKIAFDNYYHCDQCGSHNDLEIHFLNYKHLDNIDKIPYRILCKKHHGLIN